MLKIIYRPEDGPDEEYEAERVEVEREGPAKGRGIRIYASADDMRALRHFPDGAGGVLTVENENGIVIDTYHV